MKQQYWVAALMLTVGLSGSALAAKTDLTLGMQLEPPNLDPTGGAAAAIDEVVYANIFEGLTRFGSDGSVGPALAESWTIENDGSRYVFALQSGVTFHDGSDFTAEDVKFSIDRAMAEDSTNAQKGLFANIDSVEVVDDATVAINLKQADGSLLFNLAWGDAIILDSESAENAATNPVGTGPFVFDNWVQGDRIDIIKNADYWGTPAKLDKATFKFISEPTAAYAAILAGDLDAFPNYPAPENLAQLDADPRYSVVLGSTEGETILSTNNAAPPFNDVRVRKALAHAINRGEIIDGAMFGYGTPIGTHFAPHNPAYVDLIEQSNYDPDMAKALLKEAGHEDGLTVSLYYFQYDNADLQALMTEFGTETDQEKRTMMLQDAQRMISADYVNGYLFQLAKTGVANSKIKGLWENSPTQANDLTAVYWED